MAQPRSISRDETIRRWETIWPYGSVFYSMNTLHLPDLYRQDCSGAVSMSVDLPHDYPGSWGGLSTVSMVTSGLWYRIERAELLRGDVLMIGGEGTDGANGHVMTFEQWTVFNSRCIIWEQAGGVDGPRRREIAYSTKSAYLPYRYRYMVDEEPSKPARQRRTTMGVTFILQNNGEHGGIVLAWPSDRLGKYVYTNILPPAVVVPAGDDSFVPWLVSLLQQAGCVGPVEVSTFDEMVPLADAPGEAPPPVLGEIVFGTAGVALSGSLSGTITPSKAVRA